MTVQHVRPWSEAVWVLFGGDRPYYDFNPSAPSRDTAVQLHLTFRPQHAALEKAKVSLFEADADDDDYKTATIH